MINKLVPPPAHRNVVMIAAGAIPIYLPRRHCWRLDVVPAVPVVEMLLEELLPLERVETERAAPVHGGGATLTEYYCGSTLAKIGPESLVVLPWASGPRRC